MLHYASKYYRVFCRPALCSPLKSVRRQAVIRRIKQLSAIKAVNEMSVRDTPYQDQWGIKICPHCDHACYKKPIRNWTEAFDFEVLFPFFREMGYTVSLDVPPLCPKCGFRPQRDYSLFMFHISDSLANSLSIPLKNFHDLEMLLAFFRGDDRYNSAVPERQEAVQRAIPRLCEMLKIDPQRIGLALTKPKKK